MSFKNYVKEQEELVILDQEKTKKQKVADLIRTMEDLNDEKFRGFAKDELGMEEAEAEALVYKMLRDFLLAGDKDEDGIPDGIEDLDLDADALDIDDVELDVDELPVVGDEEEDDIEITEV
jgi:hypothetical protein